jgi:hypothetical protein
MVVSDAGLASTDPEWWNASPIGCLLIALQPRGGWQVMQRAVQWGNDFWARSFGVSCKMPTLHCYFACSMRNRIEVWNSLDFISPMEGNPDDASAPLIPTETTKTLEPNKTIEIKSTGESGPKTLQVETSKSSSSAPPNTKNDEKKAHGDSGWKMFNHKTGLFSVRRPTKLIDGSRGGQAFVCSVLGPESGNAYSMEEQARLQFLSIVLVAAALTKSDSLDTVGKVLRDDFDLKPDLGSVFHRLALKLIACDFVVLGFVSSVFYALWGHNIYGTGAPYVLQICSLTSWAFGAAGLLMIGGNPRVKVIEGNKVPLHIQARLDTMTDDYEELSFGSLHGSIFIQDRGSCYIHKDVLKAVCGMSLQFTRTFYWQVELIWFSVHILISVSLQVAASRVATIESQLLGIVFLISTSIFRGQGVSGPEDWMIPKWKMRKGTGYAVQLQGQILSRAK